MERYSVITGKNPREIVLLRGSGCKWRRCRFCDYHLDFSRDETANFKLNKKELDKVKGLYGVLEAINSGSFCDLDQHTVSHILDICKEKAIRQLHIECHWKDRHTLPTIRRPFADAGVKVVVKMGVETFDAAFREEVLDKGMEYAAPHEIAAYADEVCLLFGLAGQTVASMEADLLIGLEYFQRICVNLMTENTSAMKPDRQVLDRFFNEVYPNYRENERIDILLENTGFGVGGPGNEE